MVGECSSFSRLEIHLDVSVIGRLLLPDGGLRRLVPPGFVEGVVVLL